MAHKPLWGTMRKAIFIVPFLVFSLTESFSQSGWSFELHGGEVYNVPMPLTIGQEGYPGLKLTARYTTEPFTLPVYWDMRLGRWQNSKCWEFEVIHHKLYLENTTAEIQKFNISHGFNMLFLNRGFDCKTFRYRTGIGVVMAHPESNIRGKEFGSSVDNYDWGYYLSGPVLNLAIGKPFRINDRFYLDLEAKTTLAYAHVKIADGHANVYNLALHLILGIGYDLIKSKEK